MTPKDLRNLSSKQEGKVTEALQARRKLLKSRFSVFDGGNTPHEGLFDRTERSGEHRYHSECYACPVGKAFEGVSKAASSDAFEGLLEAVADLIRTGSKFLDALASRSSSLSHPPASDGIERVSVE